MKKILNNKFYKIICGAGNENLKEIEIISYIYASVGFNMIDVAAKNDVINAAKKGIEKANKQNNVEICVSIGLQNDIHFSKAIINRHKCINCKECLNICPQNAIFEEDNRILVNEKNCIGCGKCIEICSQNAIIKENKYKPPVTMLLSVLSDDIDCVEFHCTSDNEDIIKENWEQIKSVFNGRLGFCLDRSQLGNEKLINLIKEMTKDNNEVLIQTDGKPMSGGNDDYKSNIQAVAFAELVKSNDINAKIILSGGTNSKTSEFTKLCGIDIDGVAIGSYARKLVKEEICNPKFWEDRNIQETAIAKAGNLFNKLAIL